MKKEPLLFILWANEINSYIFSSLSGHRYGCVIKVQDKGIDVIATAKSYKNAKNLAAKKVLSILRASSMI